MKNRYFLLISVFLFYFPLLLHSQQVGTISDSTLYLLNDLEEVRILGTKHTSPLINQALAVTAISSRELEYKEVNYVKELTSRIPNFFMPDYGSKLTSPVYLRGIGSRINSPAVALYVDNVPFFEKSMFDFELYNVDAIEVLRGPQGTLYGRNTMGGIINVYTKNPGDNRSTHLKLTGGNYNSYRSQVVHNQPISNSLNLNFAGTFNLSDGYYYNVFTNDKVDQSTGFSGRIKANHSITGNLSAVYTFYYDNSAQGGYPYALYNEDSQTSQSINYDNYSLYQRNMLSGNALLKYKGRYFDIHSVTSYQYFDDHQDIDQDFTPRSLFAVIQDQSQNMVSQEIIIKSTIPSSKIEWLFGTFGFIQNLDKFVEVSYGAYVIAQYNLPGSTSMQKSYDHTIAGGAIFQQTTINNLLTPGLSLLLGLRLDTEVSSLDYFYDRVVLETSTRMDEFINTLNYIKFLPKSTITYNFLTKQMVYASVAKGYNSGGFNSTIEREEDKTFEPEHSWNYEVGAKNSWFGNRLISRTSIFYIDWSNQQIYQPVPSGQGSMLTNAGKSISKGIEIELIAQLNGNFRSQLSYGYTDAYFVKYEKTELVNYNGNKIPYIPNHTFNIGGTYSIHFKKATAKRLDIDINYQGIGKHFWNEENNAYQDYYGLLYSRVNLAFSKFSVSIWGKNILNNQYHSFYFKALGNSYVQMGRPALFGATIDLKF